MDVIQLELTWVGWPNGLKLASTCVQSSANLISTKVSASHRKSTQMYKACPNGYVSRPRFSTCVYLRLCFARALHIERACELLLTAVFT